MIATNPWWPGVDLLAPRQGERYGEVVATEIDGTYEPVSRNINIVEFISCSTNTIIILDGRQALDAFSLLQNYT